MGGFNLSDFCWKNNTVERKESRRFLQCVEGYFQRQLVRKTAMEDVQLDWLSVNESFARGDIDWVLGKFSSLE